jgi:FtsZ-binding cell division protein ZapB
MTSIKSLQSEIDDYEKKVETAQREANHLRSSAANYTANGYPDKAESESNLAVTRDNEANDYTQKIAELQAQLQDLESQANDIRNRIADDQKRLNALTGDGLGSWL